MKCPYDCWYNSGYLLVRESGLADQGHKLGQGQCATVGLWVIHQGYLQQCRSLIALPYLQQNGLGGGSPYSEGDVLDLLGLIHAIHGEAGINTVSA